MPQHGPKMPPRWRQDPSKWPQLGPTGLQKAARRPQDVAKTPSGRLRDAQTLPQGTPRPPRDPPRLPQSLKKLWFLGPQCVPSKPPSLQPPIGHDFAFWKRFETKKSTKSISNTTSFFKTSIFVNFRFEQLIG